MAPGGSCQLVSSDFPAYCVNALGERHFLIAGGGGQAKTGVPNAIEIFELKLVENKVIASSVCRNDNGVHAVMNCSSFFDGRKYHLATGEDNKCHIYTITYQVNYHSKSEGKNREEYHIRKRIKGEEKVSKEDKEKLKQLKFDFTKVKNITTDFSKDGSFQKVVRFSPDQKIFATGGADGYLRVWQYPECNKIHDIKAHRGDIDDIDISPCNKKLVTVSRDNTCIVWSTVTGEQLKYIKCNGDEKYRFRCCRYGVIADKKNHYNLYALSIPSKRTLKCLPCFIKSYDGIESTFKKECITGTEILSSMAVSKDGVYIGIGTISGGIAVYISFSLQKLYSVKEAHSIFVTDVEFMPISKRLQTITGVRDFALLSVSADNTVQLHQVIPRRSYNTIWLLVGMFLIMYCLCWILTQFGI